MEHTGQQNEAPPKTATEAAFRAREEDRKIRAIDLATAIERVFTYHPANDVQQVQYANIREAARQLVFVIWTNSPPSADRTAAIRKVREAVMTANAAIALDGLSL